MLDVLGYTSIDRALADAVPATQLGEETALALPPATECEVAELASLGREEQGVTSDDWARLLRDDTPKR